MINLDSLSPQQGGDSDVQTPGNFGKYLESFLAFTTHPSQVNLMLKTSEFFSQVNQNPVVSRGISSPFIQGNPLYRVTY